MLLAERLVNGGAEFSEDWNFGPREGDAKTVSWIADHLGQKFPHLRWVPESRPQPLEAGVLKLDITKAAMKLRWSPKWSMAEALDKTVIWHQAWKENLSMAEVSFRQIIEYEAI